MLGENVGDIDGDNVGANEGDKVVGELVMFPLTLLSSTGASNNPVEFPIPNIKAIPIIVKINITTSRIGILDAIIFASKVNVITK